jgi:hypothetical protein
MASHDGRSSVRALSASINGEGKVYEYQCAHAGPEATIMSLNNHVQGKRMRFKEEHMCFSIESNIDL